MCRPAAAWLPILDPEAEFQETVNKARALMAAADEAVRYASTAKRGQ